MSSLLQVFAKAPLPGRVKTRIARELGDSRALCLHQLLCEHTIRVALTSQADAVEIWTTEPRHDYFDQFAVPLYVQQGAELGARMAFAQRHGLSRSDRVVVIGADAYSLTPAYLNRAFDCLRHTEIVVGPAQDGGYVLLGATRHWPQLFQNIAWGSARVWPETLAILREHDIGFQALPERWDIDTVADLKRHAPELLKQLQDAALS